MSWLLFLDESGHDHRNTPYEVRGGFAIHASRLWSLIQELKSTEHNLFGAPLHVYGSELKGAKLLKKCRFKWHNQGDKLDQVERRKHALNFLNSMKQQRAPRRQEFAAYGQASIAMADAIVDILLRHEVKVFAAMIPRVSKPGGVPPDFLRKDQVFLFERFYYFLLKEQATGLIVMDGSDKAADRRFARLMERYFTLTLTGKQRTEYIVPAPFFVESDMAYGIQAADFCIYCLNWAFRLNGMTEPTREEIEPFVWLLQKMIWHGDGYRGEQVFKTHGVVHVPDPYEGR